MHGGMGSSLWGKAITCWGNANDTETNRDGMEVLWGEECGQE